MREILFRGKRADTGEWNWGNLVRRAKELLIVTLGFICGEVIPETVGQYTGLTDKNGKRIFEGDILIYVVDGEYDVNEKYLVVFDDDEAAFKVRFYYKGKFACYDDIAPCEKLEIIGNIHDSPELLEGEHNG